MKKAVKKDTKKNPTVKVQAPKKPVPKAQPSKGEVPDDAKVEVKEIEIPANAQEISDQRVTPEHSPKGWKAEVGSTVSFTDVNGHQFTGIVKKLEPLMIEMHQVQNGVDTTTDILVEEGTELHPLTKHEWYKRVA